MFGKPPEVVPDDLTVTEYHELGLWYEESQMFAQARQAFEQAIALDPAHPLAIQAKRALDSRLSGIGVPSQTLADLRSAEIQIQLHPASAKKTAEKLIKAYPNFDAPHRLLASFYLHEGNLEGCIQEVQTALALNPASAPSMALMARAQVVNCDYAAASTYLAQALAAMPDDDELRRLRRSIEFLTGIEDVNTPIAEQVGVLGKRLQALIT